MTRYMQRYIHHAFLLLTAFVLALSAAAQSGEIRYVKMDGDNAKDGTSWETAKRDIQAAINDLAGNNLSGEVWVAAGTYYPTETTESTSSLYYKSFKIPAGITVRGGFDKDHPETSLAARVTVSDKNFGTGGTDAKTGMLDGEPSKSGVYKNQTILCGDLNASKKAKLTWNEKKQQFDVAFYGNSYHVVWFAMGGFNPATGRANPLKAPAKLEGCIVEGGHANNRDANALHPHEAYGGGIYMVLNSFVYNCEVRNCDASRNGGGIYMDGGGIVRRTYVHDCQALGLGTEFGYGGGICENGSALTSKARPVVVAQSVVSNCVGRMGGGMALLADATTSQSKYTVVGNSTLVNNNTATIEAGGVYTYKGGGCASMTIVNNKCNGSGITQNGSITGRSGGLYSYDAAYVGNTVIWGNECEANKDIQYASSRSNLNSTEKSLFYHSALSHADITDWSTASKLNVISLEATNEATPESHSTKGFPLFRKPSTNTIAADGDTPERTVNAAGYYKPYSTGSPLTEWIVSSESALTYAGINTADLDNEGLTPAPTGKAYDMQFGKFNARPTIGALIAEKVDIAPKTEGDRVDFFVDPTFIYAENNTGHNGNSWTTPVRFLGNVLDYIADKNKTNAYAGKKVYVHVKEGIVDNTRAESDEDRVRLTPLNIPSSVTILGSYDSSLSDTDLSRRNPVLTPTVISARLMNNYDFNVAHLIVIDDKKDVTIDGFKITFANAHTTALANTNTDGAAITLKNCVKHGGDGDANIHFRNLTISNCYGDKGTVVYADNSSADFENCIFHNNTTDIVEGSGLIYGVNHSDLRFDHCNVLRSVGHASYLDATTKNVWKNSMFYGNLREKQDNTNNCNYYSIAAFDGPGAVPANLTGERCMFDLVSKPLYDKAPFNLGAGIPANSTYYVRTKGKDISDTEVNGNGLEYAYSSGWANGYPRMVNPTKNAGYSTEGDVTYYGRATSFEPHNDNPVVNAGGTDGEPHSARRWGTDITTVITRDFGGLPDIGAIESHTANVDEIANENGNPDGQMPYGVAYYVRDYAQNGMPQTYTKEADGTFATAADGKGNYVKEGDDYIFLDGASWQYAVSGNAPYTEDFNAFKIATFIAKVKVEASDESFLIYNAARGRYIYLNGTTLGTTNNIAQATKWYVKGTGETGTISGSGNQVIYAKASNGSTYCLSFSSNSPSAVKSDNTSIYLQYVSSSNFRIRPSSSSNYCYSASTTGFTSRNTTANNYALWQFIDQNTSRAAEYEEVPNPSTAAPYGTKAVAQNATVGSGEKLHVYKSLDDYKKLSDVAVTYKIAQQPAGGAIAGYLTNNGSNYAVTNATAGNTYALISANENYKYYIYDVTTGRYLYNYNNAASPIRETSSESERSPWFVVESNASDRFNISLGIGSSIPTTGWVNAGSGSNVTLATSTGTNAQWVLIAQKAYTPYGVSVTQHGLNGLQYAVNTVHDEYVDGGVQHEVHVAQGVYTNASPEDAVNTVYQPYAYMMKEGVNVLGGYPTIGNPGEDQRQPKMYETILQAQEQSPYVTMTFVTGANHPDRIRVNSNQDSWNDMMSVTNWGSCSSLTDANDKASKGRVLVQPGDFNVQTSWDGFTIRHGYLNTAYRKNLSSLAGLTTDNVKVAGGAGVLLQGNGMLVNCEIKENLILVTPGGVLTTMGEDNGTTDSHSHYTNHSGGAGVFMTGTTSTATIENCNIGSNQLLTKAVYTVTGSTHGTTYDNIWMYGAGLFQNNGNVYNTIIHDNIAATIRGTMGDWMNASPQENQEMILGGGAFIADGNFFNNTIVANIATSFYHQHVSHCTFAGVHVKDQARIYNSIIADNVSNWGFKNSWNATNSESPGNGVPVSAFETNSIAKSSRDPSKVFVTYSYVDVHKQEKGVAAGVTTWVDLVSKNDTKNTNIYLDYNQKEAFTSNRTTVIHPASDVYDHTAGANKYRLITNSPCINTGTVDLKDAQGNAVVIPDFDAGYDDRIQDCKIDIGAYESDGRANIKPQTVGSNQLIFYVSPDGFGRTDGSDPENAACAPKLQMVIDAAGRYKLQNPTKQVIVKVANSYSMRHPANAADAADFTYYSTRTADQTSTDTRLWSIQIPRGVEVWGGYTDVPTIKDANGNVVKNTANTNWSNTNNGYQHRSITGNPTYFDSYFYNKDMKINATTYHVVTFTERVYDKEGHPFLAKDYNSSTHKLAEYSSYTGTEVDEDLFLHMKDYVSGNVMAAKVDGKTVSNRAVLDGIFVTGGNADGKTISGSSSLNANGYGGAAIVTDYAYVRNCIVMNNSATNGGGLALTNEALVSGSLIIENNADNMGGGLYVFEQGAALSNGIVIDSKAPADQTMDYRMSHVLTSTIVGNSAQQGGGVWYTNDTEANARFNSVVIWQNFATDQENVHGMVNPEQPTEDETLSEIYYPFAYSLIQNIRASGTNNLSAEPLNEQGVRFVDKTTDVGQTKNGASAVDQFNMAEEKDEASLEQKLANFGYYGLTHYSMLCSTGMPVRFYEQMKAAIAIADDDILSTPRISDASKFVEIGARALPKVLPKKQLMLRLFVANPEDVDTKTAGRFMRLANTAAAGSAAEYYAQEGSSFAYPFNFLQDALDYVKAARNGEITGETTPKDLPFEIVVGKGTYYPTKDLNGETQSVWAHTFAIPEGVTIVGGFNPQGGVGTYYGRYNKVSTSINTTSVLESSPNLAMSIYDNVTPIPNDTQRATEAGQREIGRGYKSGNEDVELPAVGTNGQPGYMDAQRVTFQQWNIQDICDRRAMADNNKNGIVEPWEFANQTIISGNAVNGETDGVYHVMTAVADADAVGNLPTAGYRYNVSFPNAGAENGYKCWEYGQQIRLNGLIITGGNALTYLSTALDEYGKYIYYQGAGLQVDGNRYKATIDTGASHTEPVFHNSAAYGVGYRDIPISIINCQFRNNVAGYGGAISTNGTLDTYASSFEQNLAIAQTETPKGGDEWFSMVSGSKETVSRVMYPGQGGAILATGQLSCYNTLFANNEARLGDGEEQTIDRVVHPTFRVPDGGTNSIRAAGGAIMVGSAGRYHMMNCDFVRNKANAYPVIFTMNPNSTEDEKGKDEKTSTEHYNQIVSTVVWGNEVNPDMLNKFKGNPYYQFASKMMVNVGKKSWKTDGSPAYNPTFSVGNVPSSQEDLDANWKEFVWFSAYEDGVGFKQNNTYDLRDDIIFKTGQFVNWNIKNAAKKVAERMAITIPDGYFQNCNIQIVAENDDVAGPNFGNPSYRAGFDGFMEGADWSPTRFNRLTDNGSGWIRQTVTQTADDFVVTFDTPDPDHKNDYYQGGYPVAHHDTYPEYKLWLSIGNEKYMQATNETEKDNIFINNTPLGHPLKNLPRISPDPTMGVTRAYIDIGVYEYIKQPLLKPGSEVDILWVSTKEHPENGAADGSTWDRPTSDLQRAINSLLNSRNGHKKEIRIMEGEYAPVTAQTVGSTKYNAFVIDTKALNESVITPATFDNGTNNNKYFAQSLTIKGGYSAELMYEYDPAKYKTVIRQTVPTTGTSTDHLFYIADPTLRYAYAANGYTESNKYGATWTAASGEESNTARTMPIQVDGVTLVNDLAAASVQGSTIYYPDMADITKTHSISVGGKVVYYDTKDDLDKKQNPVSYETEFAEITTTGAETINDPAKLVITKTQVVGSGSSAGDNPATASAVYIGQNGGSALIYNSVFHSNYGMPLDAYNTVNVNNTFGLNAGLVKLQDATGVTVKSAMHNSALWKNNPSTPTTFGAQFSIPDVTVDGSGNTGNSCTNFTYNAFTGGNPNTDYSNSATVIPGNNYNTGLTDENSDLGGGPNFVDPENTAVMARNFDIKPSVRLLNQGNGTRYPGATPAEDVYAGTYNDLIVNGKYDYSLVSTYDREALYRTRIVSNDSPQRIDIGAYEFQGRLYNPLYVDPNKSHSDDATGENWDKAFGYGDIQNAMDLAAIYHINKPAEEGYVFVKGASATNQDLHTSEALTIRDGVTVYGSIASSYADWHESKKADGTTPKYTDIDAYITDMAFIREGVASHTASKTVVTAIKTAESTVFGTDNSFPALIDGFVVSPVNATSQPTAPVIDVTNASNNAAIVLRNVIVADNDLSKATGTDVNVAQVSNGLIYEVLMRDNKPKGNGVVLHVSNATSTAKGYAVNVTVEGKTIGADGTKPVDGMSATEPATNVETETQIFYSVTNSVSSDASLDHHSAGAAAPYGRITNPDISGYFYNIGDANLNYQLTETSRYIDQCEVSENGEGHPTFLPDNLKPFVTYRTDRDLLGNPRLLAGVTDDSKIDRGAFETWKVLNSAGKFQCGDNGTIGHNSAYTGDGFALIKRHYYPHDGSVCYIMKGQSLIIDAVNTDHEVKPTPHNPGYMLVQEGANFYGNGRPATCAYVAIERTVRKEHGSIVSVPYAMKYYTGTSLPQYTDNRLSALTPEVIANIYDYNGSARSNWQYIFQPEATGCWTVYSDTRRGTDTPANQGVLIEAAESCFPDAATEATLRFSAKGTNMMDYVYTESGVSKSVILTQNDDDESTDGEADFTEKEDMGWNCIGLPYLVSDYRPYQKVNTANGKTATEGTYRMDLPHTLWLYFDGVNDTNGNKVNGDGGYYSVKAWENTPEAWHVNNDDNARIWMGEGIFTQTATTDGTEALTFYLPDPTILLVTTPSNRRNARYYYGALDNDEENDDEDLNPLAPVLIRTEYYSTAGRRLARPETIGVTIVREVYSDGTVRTSKIR